jgi:hypothetical protein
LQLGGPITREVLRCGRVKHKEDAKKGESEEPKGAELGLGKIGGSKSFLHA